MEQFNPFQFKTHKELPKEEKDNFKKVEGGFVTNEAFEKQQVAKAKTKRSFSEWILGKEKTSFLEILHKEALKDNEIFDAKSEAEGINELIKQRKLEDEKME